MDAMQWMVIGLAALAAASIGAWVGHRWAARQVAALRARIDKLEKARQVSAQHAAQARRQIEQLQKEIAAHHKARNEERAARKRELNEVPDAAPARTPQAAALAALAAIEPPPLPAHGFADTLPMA